jgi:hypothetical protein
MGSALEICDHAPRRAAQGVPELYLEPSLKSLVYGVLRV